MISNLSGYEIFEFMRFENENKKKRFEGEISFSWRHVSAVGKSKSLRGHMIGMRNMDIIIVGGEETGVKLAERLTTTRHEIAVIEVDEERANRIRKELGTSLVIHGDGADPDILKEAGIEEAESLVALTSDDETNLMVCKVAKDIASCRVIARVKRDEYADMYKDVGTDVVVSAISATMGLIEKATVSSGLYGMISMGGREGDVIEIEVTENSEAEGKAIKELDLPELCTVGLVRRGGELISPRGNTVFEKGDQVILVGKTEEIVSAIELFHE